ncbi:MAG TPA: bifunctional precorrin-2 dehydrogenase/sirohydrochlorin ferrochelatase [Acidimicrobiales bacterium]|nr:bifunctional precorrin-2 dehydrogenase/sirohydrochlorin ferrochelatase [Acidimicrobiales bacterium]
MLPLAFNLNGRRALVLGAGRVGAKKTRQLLEAGASVDVIAESVVADMPSGIESLTVRRFRAGDLAKYWLVVSAIGDPEVNGRIVEEASRRRIWLNVVDDPDRSTFFFTALHRAGEVVVSVSTQGSSPALAKEIRDIVSRVLPGNVSDVAQRLREERRLIHAEGLSTEHRDWHSRVLALLQDIGSSA